MEVEDNTPVPDYPDMIRLQEKKFLVVGAGQGIGRQTAHALAQAGADILCIDIDEALAGKVAEETGGKAWAGDVRTKAEVERLLADAEKALGGIDGFVDIVGKATWKNIPDLDEDTWRAEFDMCLYHAYLLGRLAAPKMIERGGGSMVFIASASGINSAPHHAAYGAAKAALMSWMRSIAVELGPRGIRANAVAPGVVSTPRVNALISDAQKEANRQNAPLKRNGLPEDIAGAVLFLASPLSAYVSGQTLQVDGGVSAKFPYPLVDFE